MELPKRRRGRPTKAEAEERKTLEAQAQAVYEQSSEGFLDAVLSEPYQKRKEGLTLDDETLRRIFEAAKLGAGLDEAAALLFVSEPALVRFLSQNPTAQDAWDNGLARAKLIIRRAQRGLAGKNASMAIFRGKNDLGQKDEVVNTINNNQNVEEMSKEDLMRIIEMGRRDDATKAFH
ncbi:hypothetical protein [Methylobacterium indicum]|uniref:Uncharacterized protein n=1 Tax=Methylobacterium indicum TaxID=1775910 RepID=A0A8H9C911_9HYPH|nr:hypothetical protein [Methylobacterium indicum]BCM87737.1 hypothetical protein mvi_61980 [Methylobacterium indicum]